MRRGEIRLVDLEPVRGAEADKHRPAVIVSNDGANNAADRLGRGVVTVVPVTSNTDRVYRLQVLLPASVTWSHNTGEITVTINHDTASVIGSPKITLPGRPCVPTPAAACHPARRPCLGPSSPPRV
jgi:mRNA-degrading endonuclease toxin of MazEF toxin-antitoxin module